MQKNEAVALNIILFEWCGLWVTWFELKCHFLHLDLSLLAEENGRRRMSFRMKNVPNISRVQTAHDVFIPLFQSNDAHTHTDRFESIPNGSASESFLRFFFSLRFILCRNIHSFTRIKRLLDTIHFIIRQCNAISFSSVCVLCVVPFWIVTVFLFHHLVFFVTNQFRVHNFCSTRSVYGNFFWRKNLILLKKV